MDHDGKVRIARELGRRLGERYGDQIMFGVLSGSVARGEDTEYSDLEMIFVTRRRLRVPGMSPDGYREFLQGDLQTQFEFRTKAEVFEILEHVGPYWPVQVWVYLEPKVIHGDPGVVERAVSEFRERVARLPGIAFRKAAGHALIWVRSHLGKVRNACEQGDDPRAGQAAEWMGYEVASFVALVNRRYYRHADFRWIEESREFPLLPKDYHALMVRLHLARTQAEILGTATELYDVCTALAQRSAIEMEQIDALDDLNLGRGRSRRGRHA